MKKTYIILIILLLGYNFIYAQEGYFKVLTLKHDSMFAFPVFSNPNDSVAVTKINQTLQIAELFLLIGYQNSSVFEMFGDDPSIANTYKIKQSFKIFTNNSKLVSLCFNNVNCCGSRLDFTEYYNFNSENGSVIQLTDLFTNNGFRVFRKMIFDKRKKDLFKVIQHLSPKEQPAYLSMTTELLADSLHEYYIKNDSILIDPTYCYSPGESDVGHQLHIIGFSLNEFKSYLNEFGNAIFTHSNVSVKNYVSSALPQLFSGEIAGKKVLFYLMPQANVIYGVYVYLEFGKGLLLTGELKGTNLSLDEENPKREFDHLGALKPYHYSGYIEATYKNNQINGTWSNYNKTKQYPIHLTR